MSQFSCEIYVDNVRYLLSSSCNKKVWPLLQTRVNKMLMSLSRESAQYMGGLTATVDGLVHMQNQHVYFKLTINPNGNSFQ